MTDQTPAPSSEQPTGQPSSPETNDSGADSTPATESVAETTAPKETSPAPSPEKRVQIGSQRDAADKSLAPPKPKAVRTAEEKVLDLGRPALEERPGKPAPLPPKASEPVELPPMSEDLDKEIADALGDMSLDDIIASEDGADAGEELEADSRLKGTVLRTNGDNVFFGLKGRHEGFASARQFKTPPEDGVMMDVVVIGHNADDGIYELSIPGASVSVNDWADVNEGMVVEAKVTGSNTGGLECQVASLRGFIPASQIALHRTENFGDFVNQKLQCVITEANPAKKNLVLSHRAILEREQQEVRKETLAKLEVGNQVDGLVTRLMDFGAFVDIGGVEGLVHISKMSWDRVSHPKDVLTEGQKIQVKIEKIDAESGKIGLSYRDTMEHPWAKVGEKYEVNSTVTGTVSRLAQFGAFVRLEPGIEGLVHISELAHHRVQAVRNHVKEGDEVEVKVLSVDTAAQKMSLSIKATLAAPIKKDGGKKEEEGPDDTRELVVPKRNKPLKGGTGRSSGGDQFGLNW